MAARSEIRFLLNDKEVRLSDFSPFMSLLDYLRLEHNLCGTKEGCNEGDCGACTLLIGRLEGEELIYESVNSCIRFLASIDLCHVVTIEHLRGDDGSLHPIQRKMVDSHGSQCGFCTPGIIMSLYSLFLQNPKANREEIEIALQGNLCRCTGYAPIIRAALSLSENGILASDILHKERQKIIKKLQNMNNGKRVEINSKRGEFIIADNEDELAKSLKEKPKANILAGSTDLGLMVNKHFKNISPTIFIANIAELKEIKEHKEGLEIGACVTYSQLAKKIGQYFEHLGDFLIQIGGAQIRNMGTIGGNLANGSPIGDMAPALMALNAKMILRKGDNIRTILVRDFFIAYQKQDLQEGEFIKSIFIPYIKKEEKHAIYKISKRKYEDISTVCAAFNMEIKQGKITRAILAYGGLAAKPSLAKSTQEQLLNKSANEQTIKEAANFLSKDFAPISDVRASAQYRLKLAQNLLFKFYLEHLS